MRIAEINMMNSGSTGKIMFGIAEIARKNGDDVWTFSPRNYQKAKKNECLEIKGHNYFGSVTENKMHLRISQVTGLHGCFSWFGTKDLLRMLDEIQPDIVHLHNLHNWTINLPMLFRYIKKHNISVVWTLHDCWSFTGKCPYFTAVKCNRWKTGCFDCPQVRQYPQCFVDQTRLMWRLKKRWFSGVKNLTVVTPSQWLTGLVRQSFLKDYPVQVINNGIDLSVFNPTPSDFRKRNKIADDKYLLLGVAFGWGVRKGLDVFIDLSKRLGDEYQIVLVGTDSAVDAQLPENIISIHKTQNQKELAEIYSAADLFVNPTREENYPTVNMESIACGTPVLTFRTGGSPEIVDDTCGSVVDCDDIDAMEKEICRICAEQPYSKEQCLKKAQSFDMNLKFEEYVKLYEQKQ